MMSVTAMRKINLLINVCIYLSLAGAVISLYKSWLTGVWVFLLSGMLFLFIRNISFIIEKTGKKRFK